MNWTEYGRKWLWPNLINYPGITLQGLRKITKITKAVWIVSLQLRNEPVTF
jgi:hypothetical protein